MVVKQNDIRISNLNSNQKKIVNEVNNYYIMACNLKISSWWWNTLNFKLSKNAITNKLWVGT